MQGEKLYNYEEGMQRLEAFLDDLCIDRKEFAEAMCIPFRYINRTLLLAEKKNTFPRYIIRIINTIENLGLIDN